MTDTPVYIASDVHLGAVSSEVETSFHRWLEFAAARSRRIVLNGDLFDFWFEYTGGTVPGHERTLDLLRRVVDGGTRVDFLGGNHDWWGGRVLTEEVGLVLHHRPQRWRLAGREAWVGHGDGEGPGDHGYKALAAVIRNPLFVALYRRLPPEVGNRIAAQATSTHGKTGGPTEGERANAARLEAWGRDLLRRDPTLEVIVTGHTHVPARVEVDRDRWYLNAGDWVFHRSYLRLTTGESPALFGWEESPLDAREES